MNAAGQSAAIVFALFVFAGYYKAADALYFAPVDLTLLFGAITLFLCMVSLWQERRLPPGWWAVLAVFVAMAAGLHGSGGMASYPVQKELRLYSLTALSASAPLLILREGQNRRAFVYATAGLGAVMAAVALATLLRSGLQPRMSVFNTNPILLARASGFTVLLVFLLYWTGRIRLWIFVPVATALLLVILFSGTRGPLVALLATAALALPIALSHRGLRRRAWTTTGFGAAALCAAVVYLNATRQPIVHRFFRLATGDWGDTETSRWAIWRETAALITESPLGVGWGKISERIQVFNDGELLLHPHNILLEIAAEAGWPALFIFTILVGAMGVAAFFMAHRVCESAAPSAIVDRLIVFSAPAYWLLCAMFSGDVNDNRPFWAMLGMAMAAQTGKIREVAAHAPQDNERRSG